MFNVDIVGAPGTGKSTVGPLLRLALEHEFGVTVCLDISGPNATRISARDRLKALVVQPQLLVDAWRMAKVVDGSHSFVRRYRNRIVALTRRGVVVGTARKQRSSVALIDQGILQQIYRTAPHLMLRLSKDLRPSVVVELTADPADRIYRLLTRNKDLASNARTYSGAMRLQQAARVSHVLSNSPYGHQCAELLARWGNSYASPSLSGSEIDALRANPSEPEDTRVALLGPYGQSCAPVAYLLPTVQWISVHNGHDMDIQELASQLATAVIAALDLYRGGSNL